MFSAICFNLDQSKILSSGNLLIWPLMSTFRYLHMDNNGVDTLGATMVMENETVLYEFNETQIDGYSRLVFYHPISSNVDVIIHRFLGDRTGLLHIQSDQTVYVEYVESETNVTEAPVSYKIDSGAKAIFPTEVHLQGIRSTLDGLVGGVHHLYVEDGASVITSSTSQTAGISENQLVNISAPGNFQLPTINIRNQGTLEFLKIDTDFLIKAAFLELKYGGTILMNHGYVEAGDLDMESTSVFELHGKGHPAETGPGAGSNLQGGSYGGVAGGTDDSSAYGSVFSPTDLGSGGGGSSGGSGGGFVNFRVGQTLHIDGLVDASGADASSHAGGGSGGTIMISAYDMSGLGVLDVTGGDGSGSGYGGSGGRIAAHIESINKYGGTYSVHGGLSGDGIDQNAGGPGTVYKFESDKGPAYRELKYNPRLNETIIEPEHEKLTVDNGNLQTTNPAVVMETDTIYYEFDEVQVEGYSYVHFYHPTETANIDVKIHELTGNKKGMVRVQDHQTVQINFVESTHTYLETPCGFHVDTGGEIVLPTTVVMVTEKTILGGKMTGVEELFVERGAEFVIDNVASTVGQTTADAASVSIPDFTVNNEGVFTIDIDPYHATISSTALTVKNGGKVVSQTEKITWETATLDVEFGGQIDATGAGFEAGLGPGGGSANSIDGSGASFVSRGMV